uniref:Uncharacterized protein n=1 Tax=Oryza glaberrima TaxID=4538 RepID=I1QAL0_ORYGL
MAPSGATVGSGTKRIEVENMEVFKETVELISLCEDLTYKTRLTNDETTQKPWSMEEQVWSESERNLGHQPCCRLTCTRVRWRTWATTRHGCCEAHQSRYSQQSSAKIKHTIIFS